jgi:hypothetical protein
VSKGSSPRPYSVSQQEYANNYDKIFRKPDPRMIEDQQNEDEAFEKIARETEIKDSSQGG